MKKAKCKTKQIFTFQHLKVNSENAVVGHSVSQPRTNISFNCFLGEIDFTKIS